MKRYITGILAAIIAISAVAFTPPSNSRDMVIFTYTPPSPGDYSQSSVQNKDNWAPGTETCSEDDVRACSVEVSSSNTTAGGTKLGSSVSINATEGTLSGNYYVSGGTNLLAFHNKD